MNKHPRRAFKGWEGWANIHEDEGGKLMYFSGYECVAIFSTREAAKEAGCNRCTQVRVRVETEKP